MTKTTSRLTTLYQRTTDALSELRFGSIRDSLFGYDLFISYDFDEAGDFAEKLKSLAEASTPPLRCFLDREDFSIGDELTEAARRRLRMSRHLAVIVTPGVGQPDSWVPKELEIFTAGGERKLDRIAPLNVAGALQKLPADADVRRYLPFSEGPQGEKSMLFHPISQSELEEGPSPETLQRLQSFVGARRIDRIRLRFFQAASAVLLVLTAIAVGLAVVADRQRQQAQRARDQALAALRTQSRMLLDFSTSARQSGDTLGASLLALEGLPDERSGDAVRRAWPYVPELERQLFDHAARLRDLALLPVRLPDGGPFVYNDDTSRLLVGGHLHDGETGELIAALMETGSVVPTIFFAKHGEWVVYVEEEESRVRIARASDGSEVTGLLPSPEGVAEIVVDATAAVAVTIHEDGSVLLQRIGGSATTIRPPDDDSQDFSEIAAWGDVAFDPRSRVFVLTAEDETAELWRIDGPIRAAVIEESEPIRAAVFSPSGERFITLPRAAENDEAPVHLYSTATGEPQLTFSGHRGTVWDAEFSQDGERLLTGASDNTARLWDVRTGETIAAMRGHTTDVVNVTFVGADGDRILTRGQSSTGLEKDDKTVRLWNRDGSFLEALTHSDAWVSDLAIHPDRTAVAISYADVGTKLWDLESGTPQGMIAAHRSYIRGTLYSSDGGRLATISDDGTLRFWTTNEVNPWIVSAHHPDRWQILHDLAVPTPAVVSEAALDDDGRLLATVAGERGERTLHVWSIEGETASQVHEVLIDTATTLFMAEGVTAAVEADRLVLRDLYLRTVRDALPWEGGAPRCLTIGAGGDLWAFADEDGTLVVRDSKNPAEIWRLSHPPPGVTAMALDASGRKLVTVAADGVARWWRSGAAKPIASWSPKEASTVRMVADRAGKLLALASDEAEVDVFDMNGRRECRFRSERNLNVSPYIPEEMIVMTFSPAGDRLAVATDHVIEIRDLGSGVLERTLLGHDEDVAGYRDFSAIYYTHSANVVSVAFTSDGGRLISASEDGTARIWDLATGETVAVLSGHGAAVRNPVGDITRTDVPEVFFFRGVTQAVPTADDRLVITASLDGTARVWPLFASTQAFVDHVKSNATYCLTPLQRQAYRLDPDPPDWCIESRKWPYQGEEWQDWLAARRRGESIPAPEIDESLIP